MSNASAEVGVHIQIDDPNKALMDLNGTIEMQYPATVVSSQHKNEEKLTLDQLETIFQNDGKCATLVYPHNCFSYRASEWGKLSPYFKLHPRVRSISEGFIRKALKSKHRAENKISIIIKYTKVVFKLITIDH